MRLTDASTFGAAFRASRLLLADGFRARNCPPVNDDKEPRMVAFALITEDQVIAFLAAVRRSGFAEADFELQEEEFDQLTAEVEARKGDVGVIPTALISDR
jgi:hypothetical protein